MSARPRDPKEPIAIVGMACLLPGAASLAAYWENIVGKVCSIGDPPANREMDIYLENRNETGLYCLRGGYLTDGLRFNPMAFGIMPSAVEGAEPDQFVALELARQALLDAGIPDRPLPRDRTEVILGRGTFVNRAMIIQLQHNIAMGQFMAILRELHPDWSDGELGAIRDRLKRSLPPITPETAGGTASSLVSGRISNRFDLKGLNCTLDAACASSLLALDRAMADLREGRCDAALVGGIQVSTPAPIHNMFASMGALSHREHLSPFDENADGTMLGEGAGMILVKRLSDAERDGHRIYALVRAVGTSSDGRAKAVLAPRVEGEELALRRAYETSGIDPAGIGLVEAHGTAMPVGDETEIEALRRVFGEGTGTPSVALGTVKSMISHLIPAAGIAGIIKVALSLHQKVLPPTIHCDRPNPKLGIERTPFYLNTEPRPWIHAAREPRRAGVNAFGFGGINAHAILEEHRDARADSESAECLLRAWDSEVVVLRGEDRADLAARARALAGFTAHSSDVALRDLAATVNGSLADGGTRLAIVAADVGDLSRKLEHAVTRLEDPARARIRDRSGIYFFPEPLHPGGKVAFLFPGEGSQYPDMLADLCLRFPSVRSRFDLMDRAFAGHARGYTPSEFIFPPRAAGNPIDPELAEKRLWEMDGATEAVFVASQALLALLGDLGIRPQVVAGHSAGDYSALLAAGAFRADTDDRLIDLIRQVNSVYQRFSETTSLPASVLVAVGGASPALIEEIVAPSGGAVQVAMDNCRNQVVLCLLREAADAALARLKAAGAICDLLPFERPYHTPLFEPAFAFLRESYPALRPADGGCVPWSCATAAPYPDDPKAMRQVALEQWIRPVRFRETVEAMYEAGVRIFVEVGPRGLLTSFVNDALRKRPFLAVPANLPGRSGITQLHHLVAQLAAHGVPLRLDALYRPRACAPVDLSAPARRAAPREPSIEIKLGLPVLRLAAPAPEARPVRDDGDTRPVVEAPAIAVEATLPRAANGSAPAPLEAAPADAGPVLQGYFRTMESFLAIQDEVMKAFLADPAPLFEPWPSPVAHLPGAEAFRCVRASALALESLAPEAADDAGGSAEAEARLAETCLAPSERDAWRALRRPAASRREWLLGRAAVKEAVRLLALERHGIALDPREIEIAADPLGRPLANGAWTHYLGAPPAIAIAHSRGLAVALAADAVLDLDVGIDVERMRDPRPGFEDVALAPEERGLLAPVGAASRAEWLVRLWCAKEAAGKALGCGLQGRPRDLMARKLDEATGIVAMEVGGEPARLRPDLAGATLDVRTLREGDLVAAVTTCRRNET